jgi:hypothetical protein
MFVINPLTPYCIYYYVPFSCFTSLVQVEYATSRFAAEVQQIDVTTSITKEIQTVTTSTSSAYPEVQLLYIYTSYTGGSTVKEVQTVYCDATGGFFRLSFNGYVTAPILYNAGTSDIASALQQLEIINLVNVTFTGGVSQACNERDEYPDGGFNVSYIHNFVIFTAFYSHLANQYTQQVVTISPTHTLHCIRRTL